MIFFRLGRSLSRLSRAEFEAGVPLRGYGFGYGISHRTLPRPISQGDRGALGYLRGYLTSIGAEINATARGQFKDWRLLLANPSFRRFFSSESSNKKNYENCYPWDKKEFPKSSGDNKLESKGNDGNDKMSDNSSESVDDFERRLFSGVDDSSNSSSFFRKLDKIEKSRGTFGTGLNMNDSGQSRFMDVLSESFDTLSDGMDSKLKKAAQTFIVSDEIQNEDYSFRPDMTFRPGTTYTLRDLDLTKPAIPKQFKAPQFETTTEEVLKKADFRNVRFLQNFLTEAGIIIKRSQTRISAKAQRKVAREIKTARAFGLMPFTTMGTKPYSFGRSMNPKHMVSEDESEVFNNYTQFNNNTQDAAVEPVE